MKNSRAFIIDDEEDICLLLKANLSKKFRDVQYALNLNQGLAFINSNHVDILFLDNNLPDGAGIDHIEGIKQNHPKTTIFVISAMSNLREKAISAGADDFLTKPIGFKVISDVLSRYYPG